MPVRQIFDFYGGGVVVFLAEGLVYFGGVCPTPALPSNDVVGEHVRRAARIRPLAMSGNSNKTRYFFVFHSPRLLQLPIEREIIEKGRAEPQNAIIPHRVLAVPDRRVRALNGQQCALSRTDGGDGCVRWGEAASLQEIGGSSSAAASRNKQLHARPNSGRERPMRGQRGREPRR